MFISTDMQQNEDFISLPTDGIEPTLKGSLLIFTIKTRLLKQRFDSEIRVSNEGSRIRWNVNSNTIR